MNEKWQKIYAIIMGIIFTCVMLVLTHAHSAAIGWSAVLRDRLLAATSMFLGPGLVIVIFQKTITKWLFLRNGLTQFRDAASEQKARGQTKLFSQFLLGTGAAISLLSLILFFFQRR